VKRRKNQPGFDFIGDVHGQFLRLCSLLRKLGYQWRGDTFFHPERLAVFLGDIMNRGPRVADTARLVRNMVESGAAECLLGNHEFWTLWYERRIAAGLHCLLGEKMLAEISRSRSSFGKALGEWNAILDWLEKRPLVFEAKLPGGSLAIGVHACLDPLAQSRIPENHLRASDFLAQVPSPRFYAALNLLEGPSFRIPSDPKSIRLRWWLYDVPTSPADAAYVARSVSSFPRLPAFLRSKLRPIFPEAPPVFIGHYGFLKPVAAILPNLACLDLGAGQGAPLVAYSWNGEARLIDAHFSTA
jgi:hypothetical protein